MEQTLELVSALELVTEFVSGGVKHKKVITKPKPQSKPSKKRKRINPDGIQDGRDTQPQVQGESSSSSSPVPEPANKEKEVFDQIEEEPATQITESSVIDATILVEIEEVWDIEPSSIIGQGAFGTVRFERRRPLMANHTQTSQTSVRAVKEIRKLDSPDYMKELQAIAKFTQPKVSQLLIRVRRA